MTLKDIFLDPWSWLGFKESFGDGRGLATNGGNTVWRPPGWVPEEDVRRLRAYSLYDAYYRLSAREWLKPTTPDEEKKDRREYGDYFILVETALSSLLGDKQTIEWKDVTKTNDQQMEVIQQWAEDERFLAKLLEVTRNVCKLGDGVVVFGWSEKKNRPKMSVWDPGFFFPDIDALHLAEDDFPPAVSIAYEFNMKNTVGEEEPFVRRIKWKLVAGDKYVGDPANINLKPDNCVMSDGIWRLEKVDKQDPNALEDGTVYRWLKEPTALNIDFIPVVHIPCFVAEQDFYSHPVPAEVMQILDDIMATDTDLQKASATTGSPPIAVSGAVLGADENGEVTTYGPGSVFQVGDGDAKVIDTSNGLTALMEYEKHLLSRMSVNGRTPEALLGRVKPNEVPSGIALALGFSQHANMIKEMRMVCGTKHPLMLKIVAKFYQFYKGIEGELQPMKLTLGSYLPSDKEQAVNHVVLALNSKPPAMSQETAVATLVAAGFPITDASEEVERIKMMNSDRIQLLAGLGDVNDARTEAGLRPLTQAEKKEFVEPANEPMGSDTGG